MNYLDLWTSNLFNAPSAQLSNAIEVSARHEKCLGPRIEIAEILLRIEPHFHFMVDAQISAAQEQDKQENIYVNASIFGLLDVFMRIEPLPLKDIKITFLKIVEDPIHSTENAFYLAGRQAANKVVAGLPANNRLSYRRPKFF